MFQVGVVVVCFKVIVVKDVESKEKNSPVPVSELRHPEIKT
jgi:hypothetical protein